MSEQLYRIDLNQTLTTNDMDWLIRLRNRRVLVPVVRCEHGNIDRHFVRIVDIGEGPEEVWCMGAGIGGDDG